jgi:signal transduction histidine kinase
VVQESLTNVVRHAGATSASVGVTVKPDEVTVVVSDRGFGSAGRAVGQSAGRGLAGIRERVARLGGVLTASDRPDGGFEVRARIPLASGPQ